MRCEFILQDPVPNDVAAQLPELTRSHVGRCLFSYLLDEAEVTRLLARMADFGVKVIEVRHFQD